MALPIRRGLSGAEAKRFLERQLEHWETTGFGLWAAELKASGRLIGYTGLSVPSWLPQVLPAVEVNWRLHPDYWGMGLATEGGRASLRYGFETLALSRIISISFPDNVASVRVMEKIGTQAWLTITDPARGTRLSVHESFLTGGGWPRRWTALGTADNHADRPAQHPHTPRSSADGVGGCRSVRPRHRPPRPAGRTVAGDLKWCVSSGDASDALQRATALI